MLRSRALPDNFDMTQTLHSPFGSHHYGGLPYSTPATSPRSCTTNFDENGNIIPSSHGTRRPVGKHMESSHTTLHSSFHNYYTPPASHTASANPSPITPISDRAGLQTQASSQTPGPAASHWFPVDNPSASLHLSRQYPGLRLHDVTPRARAQSLAFSPESTMSRAGTSQGYGGSTFADSRLVSMSTPGKVPMASTI